jgi:FkbM family methyltransferase
MNNESHKIRPKVVRGLYEIAHQAEAVLKLLWNRSILIGNRERLARMETKIERLEYAAHGGRSTYIGNNRVLVKAVIDHKNIAYCVEADDLLISPWFIITGAYETLLTNFFVENLRPDSNCLDVGANFGYFTCLMARFCPQGRVIGVEADERIYNLTRDNLAINGFTQIGRAMHAAANETGEDITLYRRIGRAANTSIIAYDEAYTTSMSEPPAQSFTVRGVRVDDLSAEMGGRVDFMKVDVEGAEPLVMRGAQRTIADNPQLKIVMEWSPGQIAAAGFDLPQFLAEIRLQGLRFFEIHGKRLTEISSVELLNIPYLAGIVMAR